MRRAFIAALSELAARDERIVLLTGDLGFTVVEPFAERFPVRFFNVGVAEQDMIGIATGLAEAGFIPFAYSIATFAALRAYEFIRNGPVLHDLPVRVVGVGGGFEYGVAGPTHHALEDIAVMRTQPGLTVIAPADHQQATAALQSVWDLPGPVYLRLGKDDRAVMPGLDGQFCLGRSQIVRKGAHVVLVTMGAIGSEVATAADILSAAGIEASVIVVASVSPPPLDDLVAALDGFPLIVTVEAHSVVGGLGSLVCELVAENGLDCRVVRCGVRSSASLGGDEGYLNGVHGLCAEAIAESARTGLSATGLAVAHVRRGT